jgi:hypothetical protein
LTHNRNFLVPSWIAILIGFLLWLPGIGLHLFGDNYIQPAEILILGWLMFWFLPNTMSLKKYKINKYLLLVVSGMFYSWIISTLFSLSPINSLSYLIYYSAFIMPSIILFYYIATSTILLVKFIMGFIWGAFLSCFISIGQVISGDATFHFINNKNFGLVSPMPRAYGLTPEPSILAGLLIIAMAIICYLIYDIELRQIFKGHGTSKIFHNKKTLFTAGLFLFIGLILTKSSLTLIVLPIIISFIFIILNGLRRFLIILPKVIFLIALFVLPSYYLFWAERIATGDASGSIVIRAISMFVGITVAIQHWVTGVGLGMTSLAVTENISRLLENYPWIYIGEKSGVDSFFIRFLLEQGILGLILLVMVFLWGVSFRKELSGWKIPIQMINIVLIISFASFIVGAASVGYRGLIHLWIFFSFNTAIASLKIARRKTN